MILEQETNEKYGFDIFSKRGKTEKICFVKCDFCEDVFERKYRKIIEGRKNVAKDACLNKECQKTKREMVFLERYGETHPTKNKQIQDKRKETFIKKFGVENPFQNKEVKEKIKKTNLEKYGVENVADLDEVKEKKAQTNLERYGVRVPIQNEEIKEKIYKTIQERYGVEHYAFLDKFSFLKIKKVCEDKGYVPNFSEKEYKNRKSKYSFTCEEHNETFMTSIENLQRESVSQCPKCKPYKVSKGEQEVAQFVESLGFTPERNVRNIISNELDIYIPAKRVAIEYNGLYWHSELFKDKNYHYNKWKECKDKGILLLQFYEDEWRDKQDICKSIIRAKLGRIYLNVFARNLTIDESINKKEVDLFFSQNHLQGKCNYRHAFGLRDINGRLFFCVSFRKPFANKGENVIEIARVASLKDHVAIGGFSKIMKFARERLKNYSSILTYSDCRISNGAAYERYGFQHSGHSGIGYDYTNLYQRLGRFKFRARNGVSEKEIAIQNGLTKMHNAGNLIWKIGL